jgi:glycosidase
VSRSASRIAAALAAAGSLLLVAGASSAPVAPPTAADVAALSTPPVRTSIASQRIYFVMPDRYANGDPSNDRGGLTGGRDTTGFDPTGDGWYHGGDFRGLTGDCTSTTTGLARLKALGFTAVWVTPPFRQKFVQGSSAAYHGYWIEDFTTVDPHLGTEQDFAAFVDCAHRLGLKVILDVVVNHTADVVRVVSDYSSAPYENCRGRRFDPARYVTAKAFPCLNARGMPHFPTVPTAEAHAKKPEWLNNPLRYHNRGDIAFDSCSQACFEQGDFFGLDDLFTEQPAVLNGLAAVYADWIRRYKVDGFRIDTARHVNRAFFGLWVPKIRAAAAAAGVKDFELFGEVAVNDAIELSSFVRTRGLPNVLDFPGQDAYVRFASGSAGARGVAARLGDDDYFATANGVAPTPPTFLGNHDMGRVGMLLRSQAPDATADQLLRRDLLAHSVLYLLRGAPVVYYGDEFGIAGRGGDKAARQDLFPTQVAEWRTQERLGEPPVGTGSSFARTGNPIHPHLRALGALRDAHPALSTGPTVVRLAQGGVLAVSRIDAAAKREYVAAFNNGATAARVSIPTGTPGATWTPLLGTQARPTSGANGALALEIPALTAVLLRADADLPAAAPARPKLAAGADDLSELVRLSVGAQPAGASVAFAVRRGTGGWRRAGVDDSPPYRAFLDPAGYRRGERVQLVAIARSLDGRTAVSTVVSFVPRRSS